MQKLASPPAEEAASDGDAGTKPKAAGKKAKAKPAAKSAPADEDGAAQPEASAAKPIARRGAAKQKQPPAGGAAALCSVEVRPAVPCGFVCRVPAHAPCLVPSGAFDGPQTAAGWSPAQPRAGRNGASLPPTAGPQQMQSQQRPQSQMHSLSRSGLGARKSELLTLCIRRGFTALRLVR